MERPWPLTGRDEELRRVAAAIRPGAAGIVVAGPAGVGKTRLAREALAAPGARGVTVVWAHGSAAARPLPLGAFAGLLDVPAGDAAETIGRALDQLDPAAAAGAGRRRRAPARRALRDRAAPRGGTAAGTGRGHPPDRGAGPRHRDVAVEGRPSPAPGPGPAGRRRDHRPGRPGARRSGRLGLRAPAVDLDPGQPAVPAAPARRGGVGGPVHPGVRDLAVDQRAGDLPGAGRASWSARSAASRRGCRTSWTWSRWPSRWRSRRSSR